MAESQLVIGRLWRVTIDGKTYDVAAPSKSLARAVLEGFIGGPIPPGTGLSPVPEPVETYSTSHTPPYFERIR